MLEVSPITGQVWQKSQKRKCMKGLGTPWHVMSIHYSSLFITLEPSHDILGCVEHQRIISGQRHLSNLVNWQIAWKEKEEKTTRLRRGPLRWGHVEKSLRRGSWSSGGSKERTVNPKAFSSKAKFRAASNWVMMRWWHSTRKALKWSLNEVSERLQCKKQCIYQIINKYTNIPPLQVQTSQLLQQSLPTSSSRKTPRIPTFRKRALFDKGDTEIPICVMKYKYLALGNPLQETLHHCAGQDISKRSSNWHHDFICHIYIYSIMSLSQKACHCYLSLVHAVTKQNPKPKKKYGPKWNQPESL